ADRQRRGRLEHPKHVQEPGRATEVVDEQPGPGHRSPCRPEAGDPAQAGTSGAGGELGEHGRGARQAAAEQVQRDVGNLPGGLLEDRAAVVGREVRGRLDGRGRHAGLLTGAHRLPPTNAATTAATTPAAVSAARFHIAGRSRVVTTGSGGSPYTSGRSSNRKNAPSP